MFNVCYHCGDYREDKVVDADRAVAICPACGYEHAFRQLPLLVVCGASGVGKSAVCQALTGTLDDVVVLDGDVLWGAVSDDVSFWNVWLRMGKNIGQSGRPFTLFCAGAIPPNIEPCTERRYFSRSHYLALVADDQALTERLKARPNWRQSSSEAFIQQQLRFNEWLKAEGKKSDSLIDCLDNTAVSPQTTTAQVKSWILSKVQQVI